MTFEKMFDLVDRTLQVAFECNPQKTLYQSPEEYVEIHNFNVIEGTDLTKDIWVLRVYPKTPVVFYELLGNNLNDLLDEMKTILDEEELEHMNTRKPKELPENTVIRTEMGQSFLKGAKGIWIEIFAHCGECMLHVRDDLSKEAVPHIEYSDKSSEDYFGNFTIVALPLEVVEGLQAGRSWK